MNTRYFHRSADPTLEILPAKALIKVSKACITTYIVGGAAMMTVSIGSIFGVPSEGIYLVALGIVSLAVGLFAGYWLFKRAL